MTIGQRFPSSVDIPSKLHAQMYAVAAYINPVIRLGGIVFDGVALGGPRWLLQQRFNG